METSTSSQFSHSELLFREMLSRGGVLIGDKWFANDASDLDRARYFVSYARRVERNRRRRELRKDKAWTAHQKRTGRRIIPPNPEDQVANRLPLERRKCLRRSTLAACPTPVDIRTAWHFRNASHATRIRLGGMLLDLECYVDNSLITIVRNHRLKIVARHGGLRQWLREKCPELLPHYKTLQRIKGMAKLLRQRLDVMDPIPVSMLMCNDVSPSDLKAMPVHVQPRGGLVAIPVTSRFPWEQSPLNVDADGRPYFDNANYTAAHVDIPSDFPSKIAVCREFFRIAIILDGKVKCTNENYREAQGDGTGIIYGIGEKDGVDERIIALRDGTIGDIVQFCGEMGEMFRYIGKNPQFLAEAGVELGKDIGTALKELLLPERTLARIQGGGRVRVGMLVMDMVDIYAKFYLDFLVYRWFH